MKDRVVSQLKDKAIWAVFIIMFLGFTIANPRFIQVDNLFTMARQV